ncbi:MAG TPA: cyclopropane-fatty-acyl-phospholipid synthase family protein [Longimicrobiales bacterium]|nr:cyclopropane-fatty-acyl-phospholipid synthase family protein [Longimicrobiales bacterium]
MTLTTPRHVITPTPATRFLDALFPQPRPFGIRLPDGTAMPGPESPPFTLVLNRDGALRSMFRYPLEMSLGHAYLRGDFDIEGDAVAAMGLLDVVSELTVSDLARLAGRWLRLSRAGRKTTPRDAARFSGQRHSQARDQSAVRYHYDVGNDFYRLFLDRRMVYSCAYFSTGAEDLDTAQERKLDYICRKLRLGPDQMFLDIGCGWGGLVIFAAERYGVQSLGITLSEEQARLARERIAEAGLEGRVRVQMCDYRRLQAGPFDAIASVGMFEHVGRDQLPTYFRNLRRLLKPGGLILNQGISSRHPDADGMGPIARRLRAWLMGQSRGRSRFRESYIFPDGELEPLSIVNTEAERAGFEVRDVENLREHYAKTLRHWLARFQAHRAEAIALTDPVMARLWRLYLAGSVFHFEAGKININQTLLALPVDGVVDLPPSRADLYD